MPVIRPTLPDPTDLVIQGEQFRMAAMAAPVGPAVLVAGEQNFGMTSDGLSPNARLRDQGSGAMVVTGAVIATPCGALVPVPLGLHLMKTFVGDTTRWVITGVTRDGTGAVLGECRVVVLEVGRLQIDGAPVVGETLSDGSGNYSVEVPLNTAYQVLAYKAGSPDVGGISTNVVLPVAV